MRCCVLSFAVIGIVFGAAASTTAMAEGALAVGLPKDVAASGFSFGLATNRKTVDEARSAAMEACKKGRTGPDSGAVRAKKLCAIVDDFHNKCVSVAMDPKDGTPGVGWAIASTKIDADRQAIANCRVTAGSSRAKFCKIFNSECDDNAR